MKKPKKISFFYYNQCFAADAKTFSGFFHCHFWHWLGNSAKIHEKADVKRTINLIRKVNPDILAISEILGETQRKELLPDLKNLGYKSIHTNPGHRLGKNSKEYLEIMIATKDKSVMINIPNHFGEAKLGHGGGMICSYLPDQDSYILVVHLAHPIPRTQKIFDKQIKVIEDLIAKKFSKSKKFIIAGDFNSSFGNLSKKITSLEKYSPDEPTCSTTNGIKLIYNKCIDHILGRGFQATKKELIEGHSDHRGVFIDLCTSSK